ncbi:TPA: hypothetical protein ACSJ9T_001665 [Yersinia enterocolitica]|nr:hypothetical protein [Yersinia enterocolitica]
MENKSSVKNDITFLTIISIGLYGAVYFFQIGVSEYFGYPKSFINIDLTMIIKSSFSFLAVGIVLYGWIGVHSTNKSVSTFYNVFIYLGIFYIISTYATDDLNPLSLISKENKKIIVFIIAATSTLFYALIKSSVVLNENAYSFSHTLLLFVIALMVAAPYSLGWIYSYKVNDIFVSNDSFLLNSYGGFLVLGKCHNGELSFILTEGDKNLEFKKANAAESLKFKLCFKSS